MWFIADQQKIIGESDAATAMPAVHDGTMRAQVFAKQKFTDEFEPVGGLFASVQNIVEILTFTRLSVPAQTDEDFDTW